MSKSESIEDQDSMQYKQRLADFMQSINPKEKPEVLAILRQKYLENRK